MAKLGLSATPSHGDLPPHLRDAIHPDHARSVMADADLIGQIIRYRDSATGYGMFESAQSTI